MLHTGGATGVHTTPLVVVYHSNFDPVEGEAGAMSPIQRGSIRSVCCSGLTLEGANCNRSGACRGSQPNSDPSDPSWLLLSYEGNSAHAGRASILQHHAGSPVSHPRATWFGFRARLYGGGAGGGRNAGGVQINYQLK